jgi:hypothetical protein
MTGKKSELRPKYPGRLIRSGVRGKYAKRVGKEGTSVVVIDLDLRALFPDSASVNKALRTYVQNGLENDPRFLERIERARSNLRSGRRIRLEDA